MTTSADSPPRQGRRGVLPTILGLGLTLALLLWVLRGVSLSQILHNLAGARPGPLIAAVVIATSAFGIRTLRWRILLRRSDGGPVSWPALWHATAMGFMANNTLPFRLGELVRTYAASRLGGVTWTAAFSSIAVERALDGMTLVALLALALLRAGLPADTTIMGTRLDAIALRSALLCLVILAAACFVLLFPLLTERLIRKLVPAHRLARWLIGMVEGLRQGFSALRSPGRLVAAVAWSVVLWLVGALSFWVAFAAFGISVGFAGAVLLQSLLAFGVAAGVTPGYFGIFELVVAAALLLFGVPNDLGVAYGITYHIVTFLPIVLLGLWSLGRTGLHLRDARAAAP